MNPTDELNNYVTKRMRGVVKNKKSNSFVDIVMTVNSVQSSVCMINNGKTNAGLNACVHNKPDMLHQYLA